MSRAARGVVLAAVCAAAAASGGCESLMYVFGGRGYRQLVTPYRDELPVRPDWERFVDERWAEAARVHLEALGLPADTPVALTFVAAYYYRTEKQTELVAVVRPPEGSVASPLGTFDVVWRKPGGPGSSKPWVVQPPVLPLPPVRPTTVPARAPDAAAGAP